MKCPICGLNPMGVVCWLFAGWITILVIAIIIGAISVAFKL